MLKLRPSPTRNVRRSIQSRPLSIPCLPEYQEKTNRKIPVVALDRAG